MSSSLLSRSTQRPLFLSPLVAFSRIGQQRHKGNLAPRAVKFIKRHKGVIPIPTGGSLKGTRIAFGDYGLRIKGAGKRFSAKQLEVAQETIKTNLKGIKGAKIWLRVFPDVPVCVKGNSSRMGGGKGMFEFWATRVGTGRVIFEIGGVPIREEIARDALRQAAVRLPCVSEFITKDTPAKLGNLKIIPEGYRLRAGKLVPLETIYPQRFPNMPRWKQKLFSPLKPRDAISSARRTAAPVAVQPSAPITTESPVPTPAASATS